MAVERPGGIPKGYSGLGVYRVFWQDGGDYSVASIGMGEDGRLWLAPSNWLAPTMKPDWGIVERVESLTTEVKYDETWDGP